MTLTRIPELLVNVSRMYWRILIGLASIDEIPGSVLTRTLYRSPTLGFIGVEAGNFLGVASVKPLCRAIPVGLKGETR